MASLTLKVPNLRCFSVSASSNGTLFLHRLHLLYVGAPPGAGSQSGGPVISKLPPDEIRRPLMRTRANDPNKVKELMDSIREIGLQVPVSLVVTNMRLTSALGSQPYAAKLDVEQKKCSGIIYAKVIFPF
ncbi:hypothetical protein SLEP1_g16019 [Rubroshorea leprosula]|uniref:Sulfiredoxin n=1 Tax=Rubroshorea leprosula TaxID=152421 RepID=A0AAV5IPH6_9ROSI|nr:hypothetical protein SLEP1_g16019 [Rubroshorea leprosula]